jgi:hypothetical protein
MRVDEAMPGLTAMKGSEKCIVRDQVGKERTAKLATF